MAHILSPLIKSSRNVSSYDGQAQPHIMSIFISIMTNAAGLNGNSNMDGQSIR